MERGQTPKILCLAPNSLFVSLSLLFPLFFYFFLSFRFFFFSLKAFVRLNRTPTTHTILYVCQLYLGASCTEAYYYFSSIKLTTYVSFPRMYLFFTIICIDMT